jgi:hypothetical protein
MLNNSSPDDAKLFESSNEEAEADDRESETDDGVGELPPRRLRLRSTENQSKGGIGIDSGAGESINLEPANSEVWDPPLVAFWSRINRGGVSLPVGVQQDTECCRCNLFELLKNWLDRGW